MSDDVSATVKPQDVLKCLMYDGTFDNLRSSLISLLKSNDDLKSFILTSVEQSEVLRTPGVETKSRRQLMEELRHELSVAVLERASNAAWKLMLSKEGVGVEITEKVDATFCELTGFTQLGCDCHQDAVLSEKENVAQVSGTSARVASGKAETSLKRPREEEPERPMSCVTLESHSTNEMIVEIDGDSVDEKGAAPVDGKVQKVEGDQRIVASNSSTIEKPSKSELGKGYWKSWTGSSDALEDPTKYDLLGQMFL